MAAEGKRQEDASLTAPGIRESRDAFGRSPKPIEHLHHGRRLSLEYLPLTRTSTAFTAGKHEHCEQL